VQPIRGLAAVVAALTLVLAACGDDNDAASTATTEAAERPERIVSLSATATEILFAIDAGPQVVAVDDQSNYPAEAPKTSLSSLQPNLEAIAGYDPDLVVLSDEPEELVKGLRAVGARVVVQKAATRLNDTYRQIRQLGRATGHGAEAETLVDSMREEIAELTESVPKAAKGSTYYHELDPTYFTVTSKTFIGAVYSMFGLRNIADAADSEGGGYPQLSAEYVVQANPAYVFLADTKCCQQSVQKAAARPGWGQLAAVTQGKVVELDDDIASRWGPRVVEFMRVVAEALG
jgi:iron complex transport system substrate-binding protein